jgi:hypothetical protein
MGTSIATPIVEELRERIQRLEGAVTRRRTVLSFGVKEIDRRLPEGGLALGALHEVAGGGCRFTLQSGTRVLLNFNALAGTEVRFETFQSRLPSAF